MVKKKIDNRIRVMIENGVKLGHRTLFVLVGDKSKYQVPILYDMLVKCTVKARPSVLWCYKNKDEAVSNHGKKRAKKIAAGKIEINDADIFDTFRAATTVVGRYYSETHQVLGRTFGVCVLQDFEALTPNLLARTIETVEGGGLIIILLKTMSSLKQLYTMSMDVHKRYRTESHSNVVCRFNERLLLSLADCNRCLLLNDDLAILPLSLKTANVKPINVPNEEITQNGKLLKELTQNLMNAPPAGPLVALCKTYHQGKAVAQFIDTLVEKQLRPPTYLTAARGRGKSAAMGLAVAASIAFGYVNVFVTSPHPENLITLFEFVLKGFDALDYTKNTDYTIIRSTNADFKNAIIRINITRPSRQTIQYISPTDAHMLNCADLVVIDEAAAIPLPLVKKMMGPYLVFLASTINGYEGTGRSLSIKLLSQIQKENNAPPAIKLEEPIRYKDQDTVEAWLTSLLCLNASIVPALNTGCPTPDSCELYYINRDALFSYHKAAEEFLQRLVSIYVSSHYKNSPNDLQIMSDAPAHHLFCLLGPISSKSALPEVLVFIQVCLEGELSSSTVTDSLARGRKAAGDLIPWTVSEQYCDREFPKLSGARIVRIATHPNYQKMGYGKQAIKLLKEYYEGKYEFTGTDNDDVDGEENQVDIVNDDNGENLLEEVIKPRSKVATLLKKLNERRAERSDWIGTSYGLTVELLRFWKSQSFVPVYLSQKMNDLTGEHSCIMISILNHMAQTHSSNWLHRYFEDFRRRIIALLPKTFSNFLTGTSLSLLENSACKIEMTDVNQQIIDTYLYPHDILRLEAYMKNHVEYRLILDLTTKLAELYFYGKLKDVRLDPLQKAIIMGVGIQNKTIEQLAAEFNMPVNQVLAKFHDCLKQFTQKILSVLKLNIKKTLFDNKEDEVEKEINNRFVPLTQTIDEELEEDIRNSSKKKKSLGLNKNHLKSFAVKDFSEDVDREIMTQNQNLFKGKKKRKFDINNISVESTKGSSKKQKSK